MQSAFEKLEPNLIKANVLAFPGVYSPFVVEIDACSLLIGAIFD